MNTRFWFGFGEKTNIVGSGRAETAEIPRDEVKTRFVFFARQDGVARTWTYMKFAVFAGRVFKTPADFFPMWLEVAFEMGGRRGRISI